MRARHVAALVIFAFGTSFLVRRAELMIPLLLESPTPGLTQFGLTIYYFILFVLLSLAVIAIAVAPLSGDPDDLSDNR